MLYAERLYPRAGCKPTLDSERMARDRRVSIEESGTSTELRGCGVAAMKYLAPISCVQVTQFDWTVAMLAERGEGRRGRGR